MHPATKRMTTLDSLLERIKPDELAKHGFPRPKDVRLSRGTDSTGEEALYVYLVFPNKTPDEKLAWKKIEPMVSWVRNLIWTETGAQLWPCVKVRRQKELARGAVLMARIGRDLIAQARMLARSEPRRPKQATLRRAVSTAYYGLQVHSLLRPFWTRLAIVNNQQAKMIAQTFIDLHGDRQLADYDLSVSFSRPVALNAVTRAEGAVSAWRQLRAANREVCRLFALALILWPSLAGR